MQELYGLTERCADSAVPTLSTYTRSHPPDRPDKGKSGALFGLAVALWVVSSATTARAQSAHSAAAVKAQFVERFTRFVEWPESVLERKRFTLCVAGDGATARALRQFVANHEIKQRPAELREVSADDDLSSCWLLLICDSSRASAPALLAKLDGKPVLTIGDSAALSDTGVMMSFYRHGRRVRFSIDPQRITDAGLKARSKLLRLGRTARRSQ